VAETAVRESKSFTETEALSQNLIDLISPSDQALLKSIDGRTITRFDGKTQVLHTAAATIVEYQPTLREQVISAIADPNIALILLVIGALCIYVEFTHPGMVAPGVAGAILLLLGLSALSVLPINWLGVALLAVAVTLFVLEAKLAAHGVLAVGAAVAMLLGSVLLIDSPLPELRIHWVTAISVTLPFSAITTVLLGLAMRARRNKRATGAEGMIGEIGCAVTELAPDGKVFVHGEYWNAAATGTVNAGARVKITKIDQLKLTVEPVPDGPGGGK
jgi:membrane-bound serine protease (ClpP class)